MKDEDIVQTTNTNLVAMKIVVGMFDAPDASVGIILGTDSSETKARQRRGRVIRKYGDKRAEIFYLIINDTIESKWFVKFC